MPPPLARAGRGAQGHSRYDVSLATCRTLIENWSFDRDQLRPALGPTIPHHCSDAFIVGCRDLAKEHGIGVQMHVAESKVQAVVGVKRYGTTLVGHLHKLGLIGAELHGGARGLDRRRRHGPARGCRRLRRAQSRQQHEARLRAGGARKMRDRGITLRHRHRRVHCHPTITTCSRPCAWRLSVSRVQGPDPRQWLSAARGVRGRDHGRRPRARHGEVDRAARAGVQGRRGVPRSHQHQLCAAERAAAACRVRRGRHRRRPRHGRRANRWSKAAGCWASTWASSRPRPTTAAAHLVKVNAAREKLRQALEPVVLDYCVGLAREPYHVQRWCEH